METQTNTNIFELDSLARDLDAVRPMIRKMSKFPLTDIEADYHATLYLCGINKAREGSELHAYLQSRRK